MAAKYLPREEALRIYGPAFVQIMFKGGKRQIQITEAQEVAARKWKLLMECRFLPFMYDYVYVIGAGDRCKVGFSTMPKQRLSSIQTGIPEDLDILGLYVFRRGAGQKFERAAHRKLKAEGKHIRGEWFKASGAARAVEELAQAKYSEHLLSLEAAWKGSEEMVKVALALHKDDVDMRQRIKANRDNFLWVATILRAKEGAIAQILR